jgi:hypothetical protein
MEQCIGRHAIHWKGREKPSGRLHHRTAICAIEDFCDIGTVEATITGMQNDTIRAMKGECGVDARNKSIHWFSLSRTTGGFADTAVAEGEDVE